jgi:hypothetical protein
MIFLLRESSIYFSPQKLLFYAALPQNLLKNAIAAYPQTNLRNRYR